jgi:hypothetical protein
MDNKTHYIDSTYFWIVLFVALNLLSKMQNLSEASIWFDESHSMYLAQKTIPEIIAVASKDQNPPLYNIATHYWTGLFGNNESSIRSFSVWCNVLTSIILFLFANLFTAISSGTFFILSNEIIYYAREARSYSMIMLLCVASFFAFVELLKQPDFRKTILLSIINALLLYTHYLTVFILVVQALTALFFINSFRKSFTYYFFSQLSALILFSPWLSAALNISNKTQQGFWLTSPTINELYDVFARFGMTYQIKWLGFWLIVACFLWMLLIRRNHFSYLQKVFFLLLLFWGFLPVLADYYIATFIPVFLPRYILYALPGMMLTVAYAISVLPIGKIFRYIIVSYIAIASYKKINFNPYKGEDWRNAMTYLKHIKTTDASAIYCAPYLFPAITYYYNKDYFKDYRKTIEVLEMEKIYGATNIYELKEGIINNKNDIILIESHIDVADKNRTIYNRLEENYFVKKHAGFAGINITLFSPFHRESFIDTVLFSDKDLIFGQTSSNWKNTESLQNNNETSNGIASVTNSNQQFGLTWCFDNKSNEITAGDILRFSFEIYSLKNIRWSDFYVSFTNHNNEGYYISRSMMNSYPEPGKWRKIIYSIQVPEGYTEANFIKAYFQNNDGNNIMIDNIFVEILKQRKISTDI